MKKARGTIQSKGINIIPIFLFVSKSRITNGLSVKTAESEPTSGLMYSIHITPFFMFSITIPVVHFTKK